MVGNLLSILEIIILLLLLLLLLSSNLFTTIPLVLLEFNKLFLKLFN